MIFSRPMPSTWRPGAITFVVLGVVSLLALAFCDNQGISVPAYTKPVLFVLSVAVGIAVGFVNHRRQSAKDLAQDRDAP
jgi:hypothetical protein